ncbi:N-alpha-acetyltransferase 20-like protein [Aphelenchoides bicaudatus]|nr:N-alpha-acetyltransferase 20-like protein [Aphelenchoides bicaudatus]
MRKIRPFRPLDLLKFNNINLDKYTETYSISFYLQYLTSWPEYFLVAEDVDGTIMGYSELTFDVMGKAEGTGENWHGHVTAISIAPAYRRMGLARELMSQLEQTSEDNVIAVQMYERMGYVVYRRIIDYYSGEVPEDAFDMRKALSADTEGKSVIPLKEPVNSADLEED